MSIARLFASDVGLTSSAVESRFANPTYALWLVIMGTRTDPPKGELSQSGNRVADDA